jgi:Zn-dependent M16 (insulinase) family peptidase
MILILLFFQFKDHTSYTVKTIGASGMKKFVPIYADHLINPLLTPENYRSEVYHVTKDGEEAGVVYSEIQDSENDLDNLVSNRLFQPTVYSIFRLQLNAKSWSFRKIHHSRAKLEVE